MYRDRSNARHLPLFFVRHLFPVRMQRPGELDSEDILSFGLTTNPVGPIDIASLDGTDSGPHVTVTVPGSLSFSTKRIPNLDSILTGQTDGVTINDVIGTSASPR